MQFQNTRRVVAMKYTRICVRLQNVTYTGIVIQSHERYDAIVKQREVVAESLGRCGWSSDIPDIHC